MTQTVKESGHLNDVDMFVILSVTGPFQLLRPLPNACSVIPYYVIPRTQFLHLLIHLQRDFQALSLNDDIKLVIFSFTILKL